MLGITDDTQILGGIIDSVSSPLINQANFSRYPDFKGDNGKTYQLTQGTAVAGWDFILLEVDKVDIKRTPVATWTNAAIISEINSVSGLSPSGNFGFPAVLGTHNRVLITDGSCFALFKVNSSGNLVCVAAVKFPVPLAYYYIIDEVVGVWIAGNQTKDDPIYFAFDGFLWYAPFVQAWRLPSINEFSSLNGTTFSSTAMSNNLVDIADGDCLTYVDNNALGSARPDRGFLGWCVPNSSGQARWYYYIGPTDVAANATGFIYGPAGSASPWIGTNAALYGDQLVGYVDLGNSAFSQTTLWTPNKTKHTDMTTLQYADGSPTLPVTFHKADGTSYDSTNTSDFYLAPTVRKLSNGTYMVVFSSFLPYPSLYGTGDTKPLARFMAYRYTPSTEKHVLVAAGTFHPYEHGPGTIDTIDVYNANQMGVYYDEDTDQFYFNINAYVASAGGATKYREFWGRITNPADGYELSTPVFLEETDTTYHDFVARYPAL